MKRAYTAPVDSERCDAQAVTAANGEGCRCMHRSRHGKFCQQHAYQRAAGAMKAALAALTQPATFPADIEAARSYLRGALSELGEES